MLIRRPSLTRTRILMVGLAILVGAAGAVRADGAVKLTTKQRDAAIRTLAAFPAAKTYGIRVSGSKVTVSDWGSRLTLQVAVAHRSQVDPDYTRIDLVGKGGQIRVMGLIEKVGSRHRLHYVGPRYEATKALCRKRVPGPRIVFDLGLDPVDDGGYFVKNCRYDRRRASLTTQMSAAEIAGIRAAYELQPYFIEHPDGGTESGLRSPRRPGFNEVSADCHWDLDTPTLSAPGGVVSRSDPRFGLLSITCITGSVNGVAAYGNSDLLVSRPGKTGPFTRLVAHVRPTWSLAPGQCVNDRRVWGVPARPRVDLGFCTPFPSLLYDLNGARPL